jgi:glycosyltransferase involved in cell wall biosynthesis
VLLFDHYPAERSAAIDQQERSKAGVKTDVAPSYTPMEIWRKNMELSLSDVIVVYDSMSQQFLMTHFPGKKIERVSPPLSALLEPQLGGPEEPMRFLFWGSSPFQRGISQLFKAWNVLKPRDAELICLLDSQLFLTSPQLISQLVANPSISPYNLMEIGDPTPLIRQCDVQILPAAEDGFFEPMARQMACGKPAIVSDRSGMKDLVIPERTGLVYPSGDLEELIGCIRFYLERKTSMLEIKRNCHQSMQHYSYRRFAEEMLALLKSEP